MAKSEVRMIANNKKAYHDYFILEKYEAGIVLHGTEVKSLRMGKCSIKEAFIRVESGEMYIYGMHISPYEKGNIFPVLFHQFFMISDFFAGAGTNIPLPKAKKDLAAFVKNSSKSIPPKELEEIELD